MLTDTHSISISQILAVFGWIVPQMLNRERVSITGDERDDIPMPETKMIDTDIAKRLLSDNEGEGE